MVDEWANMVALCCIVTAILIGAYEYNTEGQLLGWTYLVLGLGGLAFISLSWYHNRGRANHIKRLVTEARGRHNRVVVTWKCGSNSRQDVWGKGGRFYGNLPWEIRVALTTGVSLNPVETFHDVMLYQALGLSCRQFSHYIQEIMKSKWELAEISVE